MKPLDIRLFCTALGFTAIAMRKGHAQKKEAMEFARLIEEFCMTVAPGAFNNPDVNADLISEAAAALKLCLECDSLTWEAEQEADAVYRKLS